jgi:hypothetical protein
VLSAWALVQDDLQWLKGSGNRCPGAYLNATSVAIGPDAQHTFLSAAPVAMRLSVGEFMRRFLLHVLPDGFHRIRHYGLFANGHRAEKLALCRKLLGAETTAEQIPDCPGNDDVEPVKDPSVCPCCGGRMTIIETFERGSVRPSSRCKSWQR